MLQAHFQAEGRRFDLCRAFADDPQRVAHFTQRAPHVLADLSKNLVSRQTEALLFQLAQECGVLAQRDAMFAGQPINTTEQRQVMHFLLRQPPGSGAGRPWARELEQVHQTLDAMLAYAEQVRRDAEITHVVNIGIGGSDLGPRMATRALQAYQAPGKQFLFVSNIDGNELASVLRGLDARRTLFLIASKTFTTAETMTNARSARAWFEAQLGQEAAVRVPRHFAALTSNVQAAAEFGITTTFGFWDWVGGRYSLMSAIGLPLAISIGADRFREMLAGAHAMDQHFLHQSPAQNLPLRLGLLDVWYRNFHGFNSRHVAPYHSLLFRWGAYLQQLEMESNGKGVDRHGEPVPFDTAPIIWGEPGTIGQHAYFQMLHQGTEAVPVEFVVVKEASHDLQGHHRQLLANALAQAQALMQGRMHEDPQRRVSGNRPSTFLLLDRLEPASLGALIALQEHRVFVSGAVWGINSFDQWGVELGKVLARDLEPRLASGDLSGLDPSTAALLQALRA